MCICVPVCVYEYLSVCKCEYIAVWIEYVDVCDCIMSVCMFECESTCMNMYYYEGVYVYMGMG